MLNEKKSLSLNGNDNGNVNFPTRFFLGSTPNGFGATESGQVS